MLTVAAKINMCSLFRGKYRNESFRLAGHDYASGGKYFITICTHGMIPYFGNISCAKMILSETGRIAYETWCYLPEHFPNVLLDEFIVMPNHVHGIIIIEPSISDTGTLHRDGVGTLQATSLPQPKNNFMSSISPKPGSLPAIIRSYKSAVSKTVHLTDPEFAWQPRYYDHLIRSDQALFRIRHYIINNPVKWENRMRNMK